jgi:hypothetical protein
MPAFPAAAEQAVIVDADDGPDGDALGLCELGERLVQVGTGEAPLAEQGLGFGAVGRVELVAPALGYPGHASSADDPVNRGAALRTNLVRSDLAGARGLDGEPSFFLSAPLELPLSDRTGGGLLRPDELAR